MKTIAPKFKIITDIDGMQVLKDIEVVGRTCYKSEDKNTEFSATGASAMRSSCIGSPAMSRRVLAIATTTRTNLTAT